MSDAAETPSSKRLGGHKPEFGAGIGEPRRTCQGGDFTVDNGMLTPSQKVKRREVMKRYGDAIEALYHA